MIGNPAIMNPIISVGSILTSVGSLNFSLGYAKLVTPKGNMTKNSLKPRPQEASYKLS